MAIRPFLIAPTRHVFRALAPDRNAAAGAAPAADNHVRMRARDTCRRTALVARAGEERHRRGWRIANVECERRDDLRSLRDPLRAPRSAVIGQFYRRRRPRRAPAA